MNLRIVYSLLLISGLFLSFSDCLPIYLHSHTWKKLLLPGFYAASAGGFIGYGVALKTSLDKFRDIHDDKHDDDDKGHWLLGNRHHSILRFRHEKKDDDDEHKEYKKVVVYKKEDDHEDYHH